VKSRPKTVLIITSPNDIHARVVAKEIEEFRGRKAVILDAADFPQKWQLSFELNNRENRVLLHRGKQRIHEDELAGVWRRRSHTHRIPHAADAQTRDFCLNETQSLFRGWLHSFEGNIINSLTAELAANRKPFQLHHAAAIGLTIPDTIITNSPDEAAHFLRRRKAGAIFKIMTSTPWQLTETREFQPEHYEHLRGLKMAPVIFQEKIQSQADIRVTIIDETVFAVSIQATHGMATLDWRLDLTPKIAPHILPAGLQRKLVKLLKSLGLRYGAVDLGLTRKNEYVFYEVNPSGQFLFCEVHGKQMISRALAAALVGVA
jgi:glutathione synthase/RimK-type ligase-like ATP-grasp enzyme